MASHRRPRGRHAGRPGTIYFLRCPVNELIKIGWTAGKADLRLRRLRTGSPVALEPMAHQPGTNEDERLFHLRFRRNHSHGEWFHPCPELLAVIAAATIWPDPGVKFRRHPAAPEGPPTLHEWAEVTLITHRGVTRSAAEWSKLRGTSLKKLKSRLECNHNPDRAGFFV